VSGHNIKIGGGGFHHVAIRVKDYDAAVEFYKALGFKEKISWGERDRRGILLDTGDGNYVELLSQGSDSKKPENPIAHIAIRTDDCDAATERARIAGAEITVEPKNSTIQSKTGPVPLRISFFKGPEGEIIEFFQNELT
jgi:glyoxylase I family protein